MEACIGNKQYEKLLRVYLLKCAYDLVKSLQKQLQNSLASCCIIIRKAKIKNQTQFGYKEEVKTGVIKKIHFVYLSSIGDLITFLWAHLNCEKPLTAGIFIDCIQQYFGDRFNFQQNGRSIAVCINLLTQIGEKVVTKKQKMKIIFTFCYNSYVFHRSDFMAYMASCAITCWEVTPKQVLKNGLQYESDWTSLFLHNYGNLFVKQQTQA